jgi:hypothetical protein
MKGGNAAPRPRYLDVPATSPTPTARRLRGFGSVQEHGLGNGLAVPKLRNVEDALSDFAARCLHAATVSHGGKHAASCARLAYLARRGGRERQWRPSSPVAGGSVSGQEVATSNRPERDPQPRRLSGSQQSTTSGRHRRQRDGRIPPAARPLRLAGRVPRPSYRRHGGLKVDPTPLGPISFFPRCETSVPRPGVFSRNRLACCQV